MVSYGFPIKTSIFPWFSYGIILGFVHGQNPLDVENRKRGKALEHDRRGTRTGLEPHRTDGNKKPWNNGGILWYPLVI